MKHGALILKRILYACAAFLTVFVTVFFLSHLAPGDPVLRYLSDTRGDQYVSSSDVTSFKEQYLTVQARMGLDLPLFYFSVYSLAEYPLNPSINNTLYPNSDKMRLTYGGRFTDKYFKQKDSLYESIPQSAFSNPLLRQLLSQIDRSTEPALLEEYYNNIQELLGDSLLQAKDHVSSLLELINEPKTVAPWQRLIPVLTWNGMQSQFHQWIIKLFQGNMGISYKDGTSVFSKIMKALKWTLRINVSALVLTIFLSLLSGIILVYYSRLWISSFLGMFLDIFFSTPPFVLGVFMISFFSNLGFMQDSFLLDINQSSSYISRFFQMCTVLLFPVTCMVLPSVAVMGRQVRNLFLSESRKAYVEGHLVRGMKIRTIWTKYMFKNAMVSLSNDIGRMIPALISGSLIVEVLFNVPGMGRLLYESILARDWPVLYGILIIASGLSVSGIFISNLLIDFLLNRGNKEIKRNFQ